MKVCEHCGQPLPDEKSEPGAIICEFRRERRGATQLLCDMECFDRDAFMQCPNPYQDAHCAGVIYYTCNPYDRHKCQKGLCRYCFGRTRREQLKQKAEINEQLLKDQNAKD